ncbi:helix-hairpin-helix domain-containing protein [Microbacterium sp. ARD32]|uniref:helix-hairpin-helix domain-containing protein n=1 Tax=Microbacterium sp. ARD32 TaxID=2962577 RepID=UPI002881F3E5|nr:helix-hairpin-helix domain-containing protein [Microbacterium sp. ARD32]MDT0157416.1 helix-hairpin-helix domain-containing protein [Microbacterium sp. ARD32]
MPVSEPPAEDASPAHTRPRPRLKLGIGAAITLGLVVLSAAVGWGILRGQAAPMDAIALDGSSTSADADSGITVDGAGGELYVHVLGEVAHPGLYILDADARLVDALAAAGGTLEDADLQAVNLARPLSDGEQVVVPPQGAGGAAASASASAVGADGRIDLNKATQDDLETLPRIGPALAQRILEWRDDNGRFRAVEDLLAVPGIGDKLLAGMRDKVRV